MSMAVSSDPDTMTLDEAHQQPDFHEFIKFVEKELRDHIDRKHWKVIPLRSITSSKYYIPMMWSMKRKRDPLGKFSSGKREYAREVTDLSNLWVIGPRNHQ